MRTALMVGELLLYCDYTFIHIFIGSIFSFNQYNNSKIKSDF